jgi:hypothetical protein
LLFNNAECPPYRRRSGSGLENENGESSSLDQQETPAVGCREITP